MYGMPRQEGTRLMSNLEAQIERTKEQLHRIWPDAAPGTVLKATRFGKEWLVHEIIFASQPEKKPMVVVTLAAKPDPRMLGPGVIVCPHCRGYLSTINLTFEIEE